MAVEILSLFQQFGHMEYGEGFSVNAHSVQAGLLAQTQGLDDELILAAFLHDIGHLYPLTFEKEMEKMGEFGMQAHDHWGKELLKQHGFSERFQAVVKNHVAAKRYLCAVDPAYHAQLSLASKETLQFQGGPMSEAETKQFEADPFFEESLIIRRIDDEAKESDFVVLPQHWNYFRGLLLAFEQKESLTKVG